LISSPFISWPAGYFQGAPEPLWRDITAGKLRADFSCQLSLSEISEGIWGLSENIIWVPLKLMSSHLLAYEHYIPMATWGTGSTFVPKNSEDVMPCTIVFSTVVSLHPDLLWLKAKLIQFISIYAM